MVAYEKNAGGGRLLRKCRAIVLQSCAQCGWAGQYQDDRLVQESFGVNEYLVKAKGKSCPKLEPGTADVCGTALETAPALPDTLHVEYAEPGK